MSPHQVYTQNVWDQGVGGERLPRPMHGELIRSGQLHHVEAVRVVAYDRIRSSLQGGSAGHSSK